MRATTESELFDHEFLTRLRKLFFRLRRRRQLRQKGAQATPAAGFTREFKDRRQYSAGDDFRTVDWRLLARLEKVFVRIFEEVQEFHIHILIDRSRSMAEPYGEKRADALRLAVALAYLGLINEHRVSVLSFAEDVRRELPPLKGQGHIHEVLRRMEVLPFAGTTDLVGALARFRPGRDRRGLVFLISDLFGRRLEDSEAAVAQAISWQAETHVVHVLHPLEIAPEFEGELRLVDVESGEPRRVWLTKADLAGYRELVQAHIKALQGACMRRQIDYFPWTTGRAFEDLFLGLLSRGSALGAK